MKKYSILFIPAIIAANLCMAQFGEILKRKAGEGVRQGTATSTERAIDKGIDKIFKKKDKNKKADKTGNTTTGESGNTATSQSPAPVTRASIKTYGKYDFIPGEQVMGFEDFSQDAIGDFPTRWTTNASGEVMTTDQYSGKWLNISKQGLYIPKFIKSLPDNFTVEFDILFIPPATPTGPNTATAGLQLINASGTKLLSEYDVDRSYFELDPYLGYVNIAGYTKTGQKLLDNQIAVKGLQRHNSLTYHIAVWRQQTRLRVYLNEAKVVDAPSLLASEIKYNALRFVTSLNNDGSTWLIGNFKYASGLPDMRSKLLNEGRFVTTGILFNTNSAVILPNSYGTIKEIAGMLKDNPGIRVKIIGHTDSDGDNAANLDLSIKRAEAVKEFLAKEFSISKDRLQTDGKGETQPVTPNTTPEGKARNRRVEFVKL
jgi:outer membrane protein OmpA-like peptidoglycan-associated protein